jgi:hypothetical protein
MTTGIDTLIGKLRVGAAQTTLSGHANFSEYFGNAVASPKLVPQSSVYWSTPGADQISPKKYRFNGAFKNSTKAKGTTGSHTDIGNVDGPKGPIKAVRIIQGG